jgi:thiol-disulfide isomerase/thioredoxin
MFIHCLLCGVRSDYVELSYRNVDRVIGGLHSAFVRFYSGGCGTCIRWALPFSEASTMFPNVTFGGVNCVEQSDVCERFGVRTFPVLRLFSPGTTDPITYDGPRTTDGLVEFVAQHTNVSPRPSQFGRLVELTAASFTKHFPPAKCGLLMYYAPSCSEYQHQLPQFAHLTYVYEGDSNISIGALNCEKQSDFCNERGIEDLCVENDTRPMYQTYTNGHFVNFTWPGSFASLVAHVNRACGVDRGTDGLLSDRAGRIEAADAIARDFADAFNKQDLIAKMKEIPGADFYVRIMERFMASGIEQLEKDRAAMRKSLDERKGSIAALDLIKKRWNMLMSFFSDEPLSMWSYYKPESLSAESTREL